MKYTDQEKTHYVPHSYRRKLHQRLLSLDELTSVVKPESSHYIGIKDIPVAKIIGSENKSLYFGDDFLPLFRWQDNRWMLVKQKMISGELTEPIEAFEYGGYYFVRDGHHRVSVAKAEAIEFLSAELTRLSVPVHLPPNMTRNLVSVFHGKYLFHKETGIFNVIPEENFDVKLPHTWENLYFHIFDGHRRWYREKHGYDPDKETLILSWDKELYEATMDEIGRDRIRNLFPGMGDTDIFCALMNYWRSHPGWFPDVYEAYIRKRRSRGPFANLRYHQTNLFKHIFRTEKQERERFFRISRLLFFYPDADIPKGNKAWYRFITRQLVRDHFQWFRGQLGREPSVPELTKSWYRELLVPAIQKYKTVATRHEFPDFYIRWMRVWKRDVIRGKTTGLEESFAKTCRKLRIKR